MAANDPAEMQAHTETYNLKQLLEDNASFRRALNDMILESVKTHQAIMTTIAQSAASNQDLRDKIALTVLETGPKEAASIATLLQQAIKAAQTTLPETGGQPRPTG